MNHCHTVNNNFTKRSTIFNFKPYTVQYKHLLLKIMVSSFSTSKYGAF
uniref:Uncharacterized protein n=1 Tax=Anguilla anguilla TaxID=7936 RepID=A0A0E9U0L2_ANGAN